MLDSAADRQAVPGEGQREEEAAEDGAKVVDETGKQGEDGKEKQNAKPTTPRAGKGAKSVADATAAILRAMKKKAQGSPKASAGKAKAKAKGKARASASTKTKVEAAKVELTHEKSRCQYLCRCFAPPGAKHVPSKTFKYNSTACSQAASLKKAKAWCRDVSQQFGLDSDKFA